MLFDQLLLWTIIGQTFLIKVRTKVGKGYLFYRDLNVWCGTISSFLKLDLGSSFNNFTYPKHVFAVGSYDPFRS